MGIREPKDRLVFPLDVPDVDSALGLVETLKEEVGVFKVGLELFVREGPLVIRRIRSLAPDSRIFLDLKFHDIPATVRGALRSAAALGADFVTIHCEEGAGALEGERFSLPPSLRVLAVTVLTSVDAGRLPSLGFQERFGKNVGDLVLLRAALAKRAGCHGVVCSGREAGRVRREMGPDFLIVVPGIRPAWSVVEGEDQKRITTPAQAMEQGADYLVVGRPIRDASNPAEAARRVVEEIARARI